MKRLSSPDAIEERKIVKRFEEDKFEEEFWNHSEKVNKEEKSICDYHHYKTAVWYNIKISTFFVWNKPYLSLKCMLIYFSGIGDDLSMNQKETKEL